MTRKRTEEDNIATPASKHILARLVKQKVFVRTYATDTIRYTLYLRAVQKEKIPHKVSSFKVSDRTKTSVIKVSPFDIRNYRLKFPERNGDLDIPDEAYRC